jgi:nucleoside-diphosphate-sugar epimerase
MTARESVLVTGATGFVGTALVRKIASRRRVDITVLVRDPHRLHPSLADRLRVVTGDLADPVAMDRALRGVDLVIHLAALASATAPSDADYARVNTDAVERLLDAARRRGVGRVVHVSSIVALPPARPLRVAGFRGRSTPYAASKAAAEAVVRRHVDDGADVVIVRPTRVYGPGPCNDANGVTRMVAMYLRGAFPVRPADGDVQASYVHVDDLAAGIEAAAWRGEVGAAYDLGGENISLRGLLDLVDELSGVSRTVVPVPPQMLLPAAWLALAYSRLGGRASLTPAWLGNFLEHRPVDSGRARAELDYRPRSLRDGLAGTIAWLRAQQGGPWHVPA